MSRFSINFYSKSLLRRIDIDLIIPSLNLQETLRNSDESYYQNRNEQYPLAIFLSGFGEDKSSWRINTRIDELAQKYKIACLFLNGDNKWYLNQSELDKYYDLIEKDIPDFIYGNFKNISSKKKRFIIGNSMGGYGALYHYLRNIDKYNCCVALSPAVKPDMLDETPYGTLKEHFLLVKDKNPNIYLSIGEKDFIFKQSMELNDFLKSNFENVSYKIIPNYGHNWDLWEKEIYNVFEYFKNKGFIS